MPEGLSVGRPVASGWRKSGSIEQILETACPQAVL